MLGIISIIILLLVNISIVSIMIGGNINKSNEERIFEDEEQVKYIEKYHKNKKLSRT